MIDTPDDFQLSLNQVYMATHMSAWMLVLEGLMHSMPVWAWVGTFFLLFASAFAVRKQLFIYEYQYLRDMVPHHSMAVLTSQHILNKNPSLPIRTLANHILQTQVSEITTMKHLLSQN